MSTSGRKGQRVLSGKGSGTEPPSSRSHIRAQKDHSEHHTGLLEHLRPLASSSLSIGTYHSTMEGTPRCSLCGSPENSYVHLTQHLPLLS